MRVWSGGQSFEQDLVSEGVEWKPFVLTGSGL